MDYWKSKVLPKIKKVFEKNGTKKAAAVEACKSFDETKEEIDKELEEKKTELQPKVLEIYGASSEEVKTLVKERKEAGLKKNSTAVNKFLEELFKIEFPGSKPVKEASSKFGPPLVSGPIFYVFEKVSTFIVTEKKKDEEEAAPPAAAETQPKAEEETSGQEKEIEVEEEKTEELEKGGEKKEAAAASEAAPAAAEPEKKEEAEPPKTA